jgi:hypothetical protein
MDIETDGMEIIISMQERVRQVIRKWFEETKPFETTCKMGKLFDCSGEPVEKSLMEANSDFTLLILGRLRMHRRPAEEDNARSSFSALWRFPSDFIAV